MSGSFVNHGGLGKTFPAAPTNSTTDIWTQAKLRQELQNRGVWPTSVPGNVERWYPEVLHHVRAETFTFEEFADALANNKHFDFGETLRSLELIKCEPGGGWLEGMMD